VPRTTTPAEQPQKAILTGLVMSSPQNYLFDSAWAYPT